jgi:4-diphosphocytidyl-2-C-methyl-D-erythritol kinase
LLAQESAPAKVNLFLHVGAPGADGYHPICSLIAFADVGDRLSAEPAAELELRVKGLFAESAPAGPDNLVLRAARALLDGREPERAARLLLEKNLPVAAGLGGGSSDAGAALRLLRRMLGIAAQTRCDRQVLFQKEPERAQRAAPDCQDRRAPILQRVP